MHEKSVICKNDGNFKWRISRMC